VLYIELFWTCGGRCAYSSFMQSIFFSPLQKKKIYIYIYIYKALLGEYRCISIIQKKKISLCPPFFSFIVSKRMCTMREAMCVWFMYVISLFWPKKKYLFSTLCAMGGVWCVSHSFKRSGSFFLFSPSPKKEVYEMCLIYVSNFSFVPDFFPKKITLEKRFSIRCTMDGVQCAPHSFKSFFFFSIFFF